MTTSSAAMDFSPRYTFACYWHLVYSQEVVKHVGSCTVVERGDVYEAAFASQVCRKPKYVKLSGNVRSFTDGRPKKNTLTIALRESTPSMVKIDVTKDFAQFEKFVSLLKELRACDKGTTAKHLAWSPRSPQPTAAQFTSPSKKFSRGWLSVQMARESKTEPHSMPLNRTAFYRSPPQRRTFPTGDCTPTKTQTGPPQQRTRRLLVLPTVPPPSITTVHRQPCDDDLETPVVKRPKLMPSAGQSAYRSLNFSSPRPSEAQLNGLTNLGNTCYMNAILQSLLSLDCFADDISRPFVQQHAQAKSLYQVLYLLLKSIQSQEPLSSRAILLRELKATVSASSKQFAGHFENDAHEFLNQLFGQLCDEWGVLQSRGEKGAEGLKGELTVASPVVSNFQFEIQTTIRCKECDHSRVSKEVYFDLPLYLPKKLKEMLSMTPIKLQELLSAFFEDELIDCKCEACGHGSSLLCRQLARLPRVLVLQLKRYKYNVYTGQFYKVTDPVTLPALVDMESYCCEECEAPASICGASPCEGKENVCSLDSVMATKGTDENYRKCGEAMYRLMSVVSHKGDTSSGHYTSDVYSIKERSWYSCNDSSTTKVTEGDVRLKRQSSGYVLFYMHQSTFQSALESSRLSKRPLS